MFLLGWLVLAGTQSLAGTTWLSWPDDRWLITAPVAVVIALSPPMVAAHRALRGVAAAVAVGVYALVDAPTGRALLIGGGIVVLLWDMRSVPSKGLVRAAFLTQGALLIAGAAGAWTQPGLDQLLASGVPLVAGSMVVASVALAGDAVSDLLLSWMAVGGLVVLFGVIDSWLSGPLPPLAIWTMLGLAATAPLFVASITDAWSRRQPRSL